MPPPVQRNVPLAAHTTLRVGGPAWALAPAPDAETLPALLQWAKEEGRPTLVLGQGSNMLVSDRGFDGLVIRPTDPDLEFQDHPDHVQVSAGAGLIWDDLVQEAVKRKLSGIECLSGIPGQVGAAPIQNIGAYGQELSDVLHAVHTVDRTDGRPRRFDADACGLAYRHSHFKGAWAGRYLVTRVELRLRKAPPAEPRYAELNRRLHAIGAARTVDHLRAAVLAIRAEKSMVWNEADPNHRSAGSFFTNPIVSPGAAETVRRLAANHGPMPAHPTAGGQVKLSAAWLIQHAGFPKGWGEGPAGLSTQHCLAIVNRGSARATDIVAVARTVRRGVKNAFGVTLVPEPVFVGFEAPVEALLET